MAPLDRGVMTRKEAAAALGISHRVLSAKVAAGIIPLEPVPWSDYRQLFLRSDVERVLSGQRRGVRPAANGRGLRRAC